MEPQQDKLSNMRDMGRLLFHLHDNERRSRDLAPKKGLP